MGRDLSFWRIKGTTDISNREIYIKLSDENTLDFIDEIPVEQIMDDFKIEFRDWHIEDNWDFEKGHESFQLMLTKQFVRVDCYSVSEFNMNRIIDIMQKYKCPLYDSAIDVRFEG
ncbi:MAG: hypothetical protein HDT39_00420 [Lachnospiraceae bacterium]|nr:hypothetical protein [Lachnospiraceae bacterium]